MKYRNILLFCIGLLLYAGQTTAQEKAKTSVASVVQRDAATVAITVVSSKDFVFGNNKYVLHIGDKAFDRYEQGNDEDAGKLSFLLPLNWFNAAQEHAKMYLVYGETDEAQQMEALSKDDYFPCWYLGTFSKKSLRK